MPFYLTNENIEATMERNPDDIFSPSGINKNPSIRSTKIRQLVSQEIKHTLEKYTLKQVENGLFSTVDSLKEDSYLSYILKFETDVDEYEIIYHIPFELSVIANKELLLNLSKSIIYCLNAEDFAFLQDIKLIDLYTKKVDNKKMKTLENLYSLTISINKKEYGFYLQLDKQFNKIF